MSNEKKESENKIRNEFFSQTGKKAYDGFITNGDKTIWKDEYVIWIERKLCNYTCDHENEVMRQGDGYVYVTCSDCGKEL